MKQAINNPSANGACNWSNRVKAAWKKFPGNLGAHTGSVVVSTPNGQSYGKEGHVPCNHVLHMTYEHGTAQFDGFYRTEQVVA